jgi:ankyrin repeat protein
MRRQIYDARMNRNILRLRFILLNFLCFALAQGSDCLAQPKLDQQTIHAVFQAIDDNDTNALEILHAQNTNCLADAYYGYFYSQHYPLLQAAANGHVEIVALLLKYGVDPNAAGDTRNSANAQKTALNEAVQRDYYDICKLLLEAGANPNHQSFSQETALHFLFNPLFGSNTNQYKIGGLLLDYGANPFIEAGYYKNTPLELDINRADGKLVARMLGQDTANPLGKMSTQKQPPPKRRHQPAKTADEYLAEQGTGLLAAAARRGELEAVDALLKAGVSAKTNATESLPVLQAFALAEAAAETGGGFDNARWLKIRELLIQNGADYDAFAATAIGDLERAQQLFSIDKSVAQARDHDGQTPLHWAVITGRSPLMAFWNESGVPLAATNSAGQTALHLAAASGKTGLVKTLLAAHAPTDLRDTNGWTPLDAAIQAKQAEVIHVLLDDKAAPAHPERGLAITLHEAAATGNIAAVVTLLETETNLEVRNELGLTPLQVAVTKGHLAIAALLVDRGANLNVRDPDGNTLLHQIFLQNRFSVYDRPPTNWLAALKNTPHKAEFIKYLTVGQYEQGPNEILQGTSFLLACGLDARATNHAGQTVMQLVTDENISRSVFFFDDDRAKLLNLLGGAGGNIDQRDADGNTALHRLANGVDANEVDRMKSLIAGGANVNATNNLGQTPLHKAAEKIWGWDMNEDGDNEPFQLLVKSGANVNALDNQGRTPLDVLLAADTSFKEEATALLLKAGANPNQPDKSGTAALLRVMQSGDPFSSGVVKSLLDSGANPNAHDEYGRTPVHLALIGEWSSFSTDKNLQSLAKAGADFSAKDDEGRTPLHYLAGFKSSDPIFFLRGLDKIFLDAHVDFEARDNAGNTPLMTAAKNGKIDVYVWLLLQGADKNATNNAGEVPQQFVSSARDRSKIQMTEQAMKLMKK